MEINANFAEAHLKKGKLIYISRNQFITHRWLLILKRFNNNKNITHMEISTSN